ncbi:YrpD family protein [Bacillus sp. NPDC077027]|uniref:YrpD family protein n=1 Tax=Bacillus sp. NPDC077027 TaxID=3390548 RepID=UPI003D09535B
MKKILITGAISSAILLGTMPISLPGFSDSQVVEAAQQLPKGIGGRAYINSDGSILVTKIVLPKTMSVSNGTAYIYSGFRGSVEADIGLQYSSTYNVWKPVMKVGSKNEETYIEGKDDFTYKKGFKPGSTVQMTIYKNLNGNTRATFWGTNNVGYTGRIITEIKNTNVGKVSLWKLLATVAVTSENQRNGIRANFSTTFTDITLNNKAVTPTIDTQDHAKIKVSGNSATIQVEKKN